MAPSPLVIGSVPGVLSATTQQTSTCAAGKLKRRKGAHQPQAIELYGRRDGFRSERRELRPLAAPRQVYQAPNYQLTAIEKSWRGRIGCKKGCEMRGNCMRERHHLLDGLSTTLQDAEQLQKRSEARLPFFSLEGREGRIYTMCRR